MHSSTPWDGPEGDGRSNTSWVHGTAEINPCFASVWLLLQNSYISKSGQPFPTWRCSRHFWPCSEGLCIHKACQNDCWQLPCVNAILPELSYIKGQLSGTISEVIWENIPHTEIKVTPQVYRNSTHSGPKRLNRPEVSLKVHPQTMFCEQFCRQENDGSMTVKTTATFGRPQTTAIDRYYSKPSASINIFSFRNFSRPETLLHSDNEATCWVVGSRVVAEYPWDLLGLEWDSKTMKAHRHNIASECIHACTQLRRPRLCTKHRTGWRSIHNGRKTNGRRCGVSDETVQRFVALSLWSIVDRQ